MNNDQCKHPIPVDAIVTLMYHLHEEKEHFEDMRDDGEDVSNHIWNSVKLVAEWFDTLPEAEAAYERAASKWQSWFDETMAEAHLNQPEG